MNYRESDFEQNEKTSDLEKIKMALNENPKMNAIDLAKKTNLPSRTIIAFLNDGTLTPINEKLNKSMKGYYSPKGVSAKWHIDINDISRKR